MPTGSQSARWVRSSSVPYLSMTVIAVLLARYMPYLVREDVTIKGQPLYIAVELLLFPAAVALWLLYRGTPTRSVWLRWFLWVMFAAWAVRLALMIVHGDAFNHLVWLTPVFLIMLTMKTPSWQEAWTGLIVLAWALAVVLVSAYVLEVTGVYQALPTPEGLTEFYQRTYWVPLDGFLGLDGKWVGPFGHNTRAGFAAAMILVVGVVRRTKSSIPLAVIGIYMLLLTSVRTSMLAAAVGILIAVLFSDSTWVRRVPIWLRWAGLGAVTAAGAVVFALGGAGLTGRQSIWPAFIDLIPQSPIIGVGRAGIMANGGLTAVREDAHNILLDEFVRFGIVGFVVMIGALAIGLFITARAASQGFAAGAAVLVSYLLTSMTDIQNDWLQLYYHSILVLLAVIAAGRWLEDETLGFGATGEIR